MTESSAQFEYDVAFSFLADDQTSALQLGDMLSDRYRTFVFPKEQEKLVATDGQESFTEIFGKTARCVVVLYRNGWGTTPWTRTEQTAIQNRALQDGWQFLLFIKLDPVATMPRWLPHSYIWHDFERCGPVGAAGAISALIQREGGTAHAETLAQKAARTKRAMEYQDRRRQFMRSYEGVNAAKANVGALWSAIEDRVKVIGETISVTAKRSRMTHEFCVLGTHLGLMLCWHNHVANDISDGYLEVTHWSGHPPIAGAMYPFDRPTRLQAWRYEFDLTEADAHVWRPTSGDKQRTFPTDSLADEVLGVFLDEERARATKQS